jgi:DNA-binding MarR family transcriptional regulator
MKTPKITLSNDDAMVLQIISESGEEDIISLEQALGMKRGRVMAIIESLRSKGLISVQRTAGDWWVSVSSKGKQLTSFVWPEMTSSPAL